MFDIYQLIRSEEIREYLRMHRKFSLLEQEFIIRKSYYTMDWKLGFMKELLADVKDDDKEAVLFKERVRLFETVVDYIYHSTEDVMYVVTEESYDWIPEEMRKKERPENPYEDTRFLGTYIQCLSSYDDFVKEYKLEEWNYKCRLNVDMLSVSSFEGSSRRNANPVSFTVELYEGKMQIVHVFINTDWFVTKGYMEEAFDDYFSADFRVPLPFESGCRLKFQTPLMREPMYGILDSMEEYPGSWYHFLWCEDELHDKSDLRKFVQERKDGGFHGRYMIIASYPLLDLCDDYMTYDWITRAEEQ